jgi:hypothetical protein
VFICDTYATGCTHPQLRLFKIYVTTCLKGKDSTTQNIPVVLYGCETCCLTSREEDTISMFVNRVLRRIFGLKRNEMIGG